VSNVELAPEETICGGATAARLEAELLEPREVPLGGPRAMSVRRTLPHRDRRMIGAWCFVDDYGPDDVRGGGGMDVPPHPHTGLQTVSWLVDGEILHRDSLGYSQHIRPGELNLMTAGRAISHSEESVPGPPTLRGVQLWVALPEADRRVEPHFEHHAELPVVADDGVDVTVIMGEYRGVRSPARTYSPLLGADVTVESGHRATLELDPGFEHGLLALSGDLHVDGHDVPSTTMLVLGPGRREVTVSAAGSARFLLIGGEPFEEELVMWWNFVGRSHEEIVEARTAWESGEHFGTVVGYPGERLAAPPLPNARLRPRPRMRPPTS
jgi:quercetin 2,3-dioxygenase